MLLILLISIIALPCGVFGHTSSDESQNQYDSSPAISPIARWIELHKHIHSDNLEQSGNQIDLENLKQILIEMLSIEQTGIFNSGIRPFKNILGYRIKHFKNLVKKSYENNILNNPDATITNLLSQIIDYKSNDCTREYFENLDEIIKHFDNRRIAKALQQNRHSQYVNCMDRFKVLASAAYDVLGSSVQNSVKNLIKFIFPNQSNELIEFNSPESSNSPDFCDKSTQLAEKIAQYLIQQQLNQRQGLTNTKISLDSKLIHFVMHPCAILLSETKQVMTKILMFLQAVDMRQSLMLDTQLTNHLNIYLLCDRLIEDEDFISYHVMQSMISVKDEPVQSNIITDDEFMQPIADELEFEHETEPEIPTELRLGLNDDPELITQQLPSEFDIGLNEDNLGATMSDNIAPAQDGDSKRYVTLIEKTNQRGRNPTYPTHWSDGTITMEKKSDLSINWPDQLKKLYESLTAERRAKYVETRSSFLSKKTNDPPIPQYKPTHSSNTNKVVAINRAIGRGIGSKYPVLWSDGSTSMESRNYLQLHWPNELNIALKNFARDDYSKYTAKCRLMRTLYKNELDKGNKRARTEFKSQKGVSESRPENSTVTRIDNIISRRGSIRRYLTNWNDGTKTMEDRTYLSENWPDAWTTFTRMVNELRRVREAAKRAKNSEKKLIKSSKPRPILPKPAMIGPIAPLAPLGPFQAQPNLNLDARPSIPEQTLPASFMELLNADLPEGYQTLNRLSHNVDNESAANPLHQTSTDRVAEESIEPTDDN